MPKRVIEQRLDEIRQLATEAPNPETTRTLKKALADRINLIAAQAARVAAELQLKPLIPDLIAAFDRMLENGLETDPQCRGKLGTAALRIQILDAQDQAASHTTRPLLRLPKGPGVTQMQVSGR